MTIPSNAIGLTADDARTQAEALLARFHGLCLDDPDDRGRLTYAITDALLKAAGQGALTAVRNVRADFLAGKAS